MVTRSQRLACVLVAVLGLGSAASCGSTTVPPAAGPKSCLLGGPTSGGIAVVFGVHNNSPAPVAATAVKDRIGQVAGAGASVTIVAADGAPYISWPSKPTTFSAHSSNSGGRDQELRTYLDAISDGIRQTRVRTPEVDLLGAITLAAESVAAGGTIVVLDSGLSTIAPLNFAADGLIEAQPDDVARYLKAKGFLPTLTGKRLVLYGIGTTAAPQPNLSPAAFGNLHAIWRSILNTAGASCTDFIDVQNSTPPLGTLPVAVVPVARPANPPTLKPCGDVVLADTGDAGFQPNQAKFRDAAAAAGLLKTYAEQIRSGPYTVTVTGMTASWGSDSYQRSLAKQRADAVAAVLHDYGVPAGNITTVGAGIHSPYHVNDLDDHGDLVPVLAQRNRAVILSLACKQ